MPDIESLRADLRDAETVIIALDLDGGMRRQEGGAVICCPVHEDSNPSCSVCLYDNGIGWHCFGCEASGDVFDLIGAVYGLDRRTCEFGLILELAADIVSGHVQATVCAGVKKAKAVRTRVRKYLSSRVAEAFWKQAAPRPPRPSFHVHTEASGASIARRRENVAPLWPDASSSSTTRADHCARIRRSMTATLASPRRGREDLEGSQCRMDTSCMARFSG